VGGRESTEDGSVVGRNLSDGLDVVEFSVDGLFTVNSNGNSEVNVNLVVLWGQSENTFLGDEFTFKSNSFSRSIFGKDLWNNKSKVVSGNSDAQFREEIGDIKSVSSGETRLHESVKGILREITLTGLSSFLSNWEGNWSVFGRSFNVLVEEVSEDGHLGDVVGGKGSTFSILSVVSGDTGKIWDGFLVSVNDEVLIDGGVNNGDDLSLNLLDNEWNNG
jgi:hypothetical protein